MDISQIMKGGKKGPPKPGGEPAADKPAEAARPSQAPPAPAPSAAAPTPAAQAPAPPPPSAQAPAPPPAPVVKTPQKAPAFASRPSAPQAPAGAKPSAAGPSKYRVHRDVPTMQDMETARAFYIRLIAFMKLFFVRLAQAKRLEDGDLEPLRALAAELLPQLRACPNAYMIYFCRGTADDYQIAKHVNVGVLAARLGLQMGQSDQAVRDLALAGWLHDIGMLVMERLDLQPRVLTKKEKAQLTEHCDKASALLASNIRERAMLEAACGLHHERVDGSGYPKGLKDKAGPLPARIIAVAEHYEALSHSRPYRERLLPHDAITRVIDQGRSQFDEAVVKSLIKSLSVYPPGSYVELNNKTVARVVGINEDMPTRPLLLPVFDASGRPVADGAFLDLSAAPLVRIHGALDETALELSDPQTTLQIRAQRWWQA